MKRLMIMMISAFMLLSGCKSEMEKPIEITTNLWVGFSPLIYAKVTGLLDNTNIRLNIVSSLGESAKLFNSGLIDGFTATQAEALAVRNMSDATPVILIDRSYGADAVVSSLSDQELDKKHNARIDVFYEKGTVNDTLLEYLNRKSFMRHNGNKIILHNYNQDEIWKYDMSGLNSIIITYDPYVTNFSKKGYHQLINSRDDGIFIYDALYVKQASAEKYRKNLIVLNTAIKTSIKVLKEHPRQFYNTIKNYLRGQSYEEFMHSISMIKWIDGTKDSHYIIDDMNRLGMNTKELIGD